MAGRNAMAKRKVVGPAERSRSRISWIIDPKSPPSTLAETPWEQYRREGQLD